jgi:hypothetical protein
LLCVGVAVGLVVMIAFRVSHAAGSSCPECGIEARLQRVPIVNLLVRRRESAISHPCVHTLRRIDGAKQQWALEQGHPADATPSWRDIAPYFLHKHANGTFAPIMIPPHPRAERSDAWLALSSERLDRYVATNGPLAFCPAGGSYELRGVREEPVCTMGIRKCGHTNLGHSLQ